MILEESNPKTIDLAVKSLKNGEIIIFPTDTIYGIACDASNDVAINNLYNFKKRDKKKALAIFLKNKEQISKNFTLNDLENKIINKYIPGAITMILNPKKNNQFSKFLNENGQNLGVRIPNHKFCLDLLGKFNGVLAVSSANISNEEYKDNVDLIEKKFQNKVKLIIKGNINSKLASTILKVEDNKIMILRQGLIQPEIP